MDEDDFYLDIAYALSGCQLIEQELKLYIADALELAKRCIDGKMPFKLVGNDYANLPLGQLIKIFEKLCDNDQLVVELKQFGRDRNFLSHEGIAHCLDYEGELFYPAVLEFQKRLKDILSEAKRLRVSIHDEGNKFRGHLWFDEPKESAER